MKMTKKKGWLCLLLLLPLLLEIFVFNFSAVKGLVTGGSTTSFTAAHSRGIEEQNDGTLICTNEERCYEILDDFDQKVKSLYVDAGSPKGYVTVEIYGKDEGNSEYRRNGRRE